MHKSSVCTKNPKKSAKINAYVNFIQANDLRHNLSENVKERGIRVVFSRTGMSCEDWQEVLVYILLRTNFKY